MPPGLQQDKATPPAAPQARQRQGGFAIGKEAMKNGAGSCRVAQGQRPVRHVNLCRKENVAAKETIRDSFLVARPGVERK